MLTSVDRLLFIRSVPIFKELRDDFLVRLASVMDEMSFAANYTIITEGHEGRALYIVVSGRVSVHSRGQELAQLEKNACFGEMSVFDAEPRSASVTTLEPCSCLMLTQQQLYDAIDETPGIAVNIIRLLSRRIRELNRDLSNKQLEINGLKQLALTPWSENSIPLSANSPAAPAHSNGQPQTPTFEQYFPYGQFPH